MQILERRTYRGPNLYAHFPVIRLNLDLGELEHHPSATIPGFIDACSPRSPASSTTPARTARRRLHPPHARGGGHLARPRARARRDRAPEPRRRQGHLRQDPRPGAPASTTSSTSTRRSASARPPATSRCDLLHALLPAEAARPRRRRPRASTSRRARRAHRASPSAASSGPPPAPGARRRGARHPVDPPQRHSARPVRPRPYQKRIQATVTSETRHIAVEIASDKERPTRSSATSACPVPRQPRPQRRAAVRAAERLGYPVVVKPLDANHGRGVSIGLKTDESAAAFEKAREHAAPSSSRPTSPASTTACSSTAAASSPSPSACPATSSATASAPSPARRHREQRPAPRHRPREGAHPHRARLPGRAPARAQAGYTAETVCPRRGLLPALDRQPQHRRHRDRPHRRLPPRQPRDGRRAAKAIGLDVAASTSSPPTSPAPTRDRRRHLRGQRRAGLPHARRPHRGHPARRGRAR
jgi:hypothetical protein